ncbi:MAG: DNA-binding IclR family transcriptional regulator [Alphaproteobacteria bacterium]|jgi:DNA-binding IclR family transcriptional regulator
MLGVLDVFSETEPVWTVEALVGRLSLTRSTAYRYVKELCEAGLLAPVGGGGYSLGPRIIELDRQIRHCDPLLTVGGDVLASLLPAIGEGILFICGLRGDAVLSLFRVENPNSLNISYSRGRPMPLFRGSASVIILAHLPENRLRRLFREQAAAIAAAGLGHDWSSFRTALRAIRAKPSLTGRAQLDAGVFAISAPVFDGDGNVLASLTLAMPERRADEEDAVPLASQIEEGASRITEALARSALGLR